MRSGTVAVIVATAAVILAAATDASSSVRPTERRCLIAWNSPANQANHVRLLALRPIVGLTLRPAVSYTISWTKGSPPKQTEHEVCAMTVSMRHETRNITGIWKTAGITRWTFGRAVRASNGPLQANVRLLRDGRVTKIYFH